MFDIHEKQMLQIEEELKELHQESVISTKQYWCALVKCDCDSDMIQRAKQEYLNAFARLEQANSATYRRHKKSEEDYQKMVEKHGRLFAFLVKNIVKFRLWFDMVKKYKRKSGWAFAEEQARQSVNGYPVEECDEIPKPKPMRFGTWSDILKGKDNADN